MLQDAPLGKTTVYVQKYAPDLLYPVPRKMARDKIGLSELPFSGYDLWNGYELSWLNAKGKPQIALAKFYFPSTSQNIIESKSFKLYLNSLNQTHFPSLEELKETLEKDLSEAAQGEVQVELFDPAELPFRTLSESSGNCLDDLDIEIHCYEANPGFLSTSSQDADETLFSRLFKSNCLATGQPDWGTLIIRYAGKKIDHAGLLKYIISFRNHSGFAEHCVEQIYQDILDRCGPDRLTVYAAYTRRGGLDINPFRSNFESAHPDVSDLRQ